MNENRKSILGKARNFVLAGVAVASAALAGQQIAAHSATGAAPTSAATPVQDPAGGGLDGSLVAPRVSQDFGQAPLGTTRPS